MKCGNSRRPVASGSSKNRPANAALAIPPTAVNKTIQTRRGKVLRFHPKQRRHTTTLPITPEGEEPRRVVIGAPATAGHITNTKCGKPTPRERVQITLPPPTRVSLECRRGAYIIFSERRTDVLTDLEVLLADRGAEPSHQLCRRHTQLRKGLLQHTARQPAPARMRGTNGGAITRSKQHRHT